MDKFNLEIGIWNYVNQFFWIFPDCLKNIAQEKIYDNIIKNKYKELKM